ncbi:MAG: nickel-responsive transcriptional regulator NikR [Opitutales bacterium]
MSNNEQNNGARRVSLSIPSTLVDKLDAMIEERGFHNRSQAVADLIRESLVDERSKDPNAVLAGTITLVYDTAKQGLLAKISKIQREHIEEVISSQRVLLEGDYIMEVVLVQGPVEQLRHITNRLVTCKGVSSGGLTLTGHLIPQVHSR